MIKRVAVVGSRGFLGRYLVKSLIDCGIQVDGYDIQRGEGCQVIDITDLTQLGVMDFSVDAIIFLSGLTGTYKGFAEYEKFVQVNELGLLNLLDAIKGSGYRPRIIFPSSRLVYKGQERALVEEDGKEAKTIYAVNKIACENYLHAYWASYDIPYTVFRVCVPYGDITETEYSYGTIGTFVHRARLGEDIVLYDSVSLLKRTFTNVLDICEIMLCALQKEESVGRIYNIGGEVFSMYEIAHRIADYYGVTVKVVETPERDRRLESGSTFFDDAKLQDLLGGYSYRKLPF